MDQYGWGFVVGLGRERVAGFGNNRFLFTALSSADVASPVIGIES